MSIEASNPLPTTADLGEIVGETWASFLFDTLVVEDVADLAPEPADGTDVIAWVSISGGWTGHLYVTTSAAGARHVAARMFELDESEISTAEIADAIGEIANVVGGSIKGMVGSDSVLSLPQVVLDAGTVVSPEARQHLRVRGFWNGEPVEFALWERTNERVGATA